MYNTTILSLIIMIQGTSVSPVAPTAYINYTPPFLS